ncbi:hypothetical protein PHJA_000228400 [Phtheirospermum japonicum]|uniref:Uncharacterized protein n=1 Tax=Phtheirospermum japonicum TaxID=374723 RepID=A0A830BFP3_9LAMI|nr:hypothetical protein PHJA_000228400 [Phtheirospermum japonicum]
MGACSGNGTGCAFSNQLVKWDIKAQEDLDQLLIKSNEANQHRYFGKSPFLLFRSLDELLSKCLYYCSDFSEHHLFNCDEMSMLVCSLLNESGFSRLMLIWQFS